MNLEIEKLRAITLDETAEDYIALHEIVASANGNGDALAAAKIVVRDILEHHNGALFRTDSWPPQIWQKVSSAEWPAILESAASWRVPPEPSECLLYWLSRDE